jgi:hypothetical protein
VALFFSGGQLAAADWITAVEADDQPDLHSFVRRAWRPVRLRLLR